MIDEATLKWLIEVVRTYRPLDFFRDFEGQSDRETALALAGLYQRAWDASIDPDSELTELEVLALDDSRVWWEDTDVGWTHGDGTWEWVLEGWSRIARGAFRPSQIEERWIAEGAGEGRTLVRFQLGGRTVDLHPKMESGILDLKILYELNVHLKASGIRFEMVEPFDGTAYLMALHADEKQRMEARGWRFL